MIAANLALRELFHLVFLRDLARSVKPSSFVLKGGANLRFFFGSPRYSEDMDIDAREIPVFPIAGQGNGDPHLDGTPRHP